jgi:glucosylceramidase
MKANGSMLGGSMRKKSFAPYARYFVKFLKAYAEAGVPVQAVSVQNEVDTDQDGRMPACLWGQEYEVEFVGRHLGPQLAANKMDTRIWIVDHNYNLWGRAIGELDDAAVNRFVDGVAWHGYLGEPSAMSRVHDAHPDKHMYWTEGGPDLRDRRYATNWSHWGSTFAGILRNWGRCIIGWNIALDEAGKPNIGPFGCGGTVTIHSQTKEITRSGQYWALAHYSRAIRRGAQRIESAGVLQGLSHVAAVNADGSYAVVLTNSGGGRRVAVRVAGMEAEVEMAADSMTTMMWGS